MLVHLFHEHRKYYEIQVFSILKMCFYVYFILKYFILTFLKISIISKNMVNLHSLYATVSMNVSLAVTKLYAAHKLFNAEIYE